MEEIETIIKQNKTSKLTKPLIAGIAYFSAVILFIIFKIVIQTGCLSSLDSTTLDIVSTLLIQIVIILAVPFIIFSVLSKKKLSESLKEIGFRKISWKSILVSIGMGVCVFVVVMYISSLWSTIISAFGVGYLPGQTSSNSDSAISDPIIKLILDIILTAVLPAICEEILHRGILVNGLRKSGVTFALVGSALCFGLLHMNIFQCVYAFIIGLVLGYIMIYTRSIVPCMIIHFMNNFINVISENCYANGWLGGGITGWQQTLINNEGSIVYMGLTLILLVAACFGIVYGCKYLVKKERYEKELKAMPQAFHDHYNEIKSQAEIAKIPTFNPYYEMIQSEFAFFMAYLRQKSNAKRCSVIEVLEYPEGKDVNMWYDRIFVVSSIIGAGIFTLISFYYYIV